ncbi:MAG: cobalamin biosynthesis protein, partial [Candidatus Methanomethyliaceae archaeon]|nr:cobalamin biosynthesis protein [Candidatus Methanomethyliaceae archaeon]
MQIIILQLAFLIDLAFGEPSNKFHLTAWIGKFIEKMESFFRKIKNEKLAGSFLAILSIVVFTLSAYLLTIIIDILFIQILIIPILLKMTFAFRSMIDHINPIMKNFHSDIEKSRKFLSMVVRRETSSLSPPLMASAAIETIAEGFVDGFLSPIFYYAIFGLPGAVAYRVINTLDSMVGYKNERYFYFGWFSAKLDTLANYIPARLASLIFIISSFILSKNWKKAIITTKKYHNVTESKNAGWPMSTMAGALEI